MEGIWWAFDFNNCSVSDALNQINKETGIEIYHHGNRLSKKIISKSYRDSAIEEIISDIFRQANYAIVWRYSENRLDFIDILTVEEGISGNSVRSPKFLDKRKESLKSNKLGKDDFKLTIAQRSHEKKNKKKSDSLQSKPGNYLSKSRVITSPESKKKAPFSTKTITNRYGYGIASSDKSEATDDKGKNYHQPLEAENSENIENEGSSAELSPPIPQKWQGLEPPPMPPGFSNGE